KQCKSPFTNILESFTDSIGYLCRFAISPGSFVILELFQMFHNNRLEERIQSDIHRKCIHGVYNFMIAANQLALTQFGFPPCRRWECVLADYDQRGDCWKVYGCVVATNSKPQHTRCSRDQYDAE